MGVTADQLMGTTSNQCILGMRISNNEHTAGDKNACNYGIGVGALTFLIVIVFIFFDVLLFLCGVGNATTSKIFSIVDLVLSSVLALLWVVSFIYIWDKWDDAGPKHETGTNLGFTIDSKASAAGAAIAFSLFGGILWVMVNLAVT